MFTALLFSIWLMVGGYGYLMATFFFHENFSLTINGIKHRPNMLVAALWPAITLIGFVAGALVFARALLMMPLWLGRLASEMVNGTLDRRAERQRLAEAERQAILKEVDEDPLVERFRQLEAAQPRN